jgi:hypothetical protein
LNATWRESTRAASLSLPPRRGADLGSHQLADASRFKGAIISKKQAGELLSGLGLKVV